MSCVSLMGLRPVGRSPDDVLDVVVPSENAVVLVEALAREIASAADLSDVIVVMRRADALAAVVRKLRAADDIRRRADILRVQAERRLGAISLQIPCAKRGRGAVPGQTTKYGQLEGAGIHRFRAQIAERLSQVPERDFEAALVRAKPCTVAGVSVELGLRPPAHRGLWGERGRAMRAAESAIALLDQLQAEGRPPNAIEIENIRRMLVAANVTSAA